MISIAGERIGGQQVIAPGIDDYRVETRGAMSGILGDAGEELAAHILQAQRLETAPHKLCPDLVDRAGVYWEIKVTGPGGDGFPFFEHSMARYRDFIKSGNELNFAIINYARRLPAPQYRDEARRLFVGSVSSLVVIPASAMINHAARRNSIASPRGNYRRVTNKWLARFCKPSHRRHAFVAQAYGSRQYMLPIHGPASILSDRVGIYPAYLRDAAREMAEDLKARRLEVALVPAPRPRHFGHQIRAVVDENPLWYRQLCAEVSSLRRDYRGAKFKTAIKRLESIKALERIAQNHRAPPAYEHYLLPYITAWSRGEYWENDE